jgi:hypothetical protein
MARTIVIPAPGRNGMQDLQDIRNRIIPMMELAAENYTDRTAPGYPVIVDEVERGTVGLELDPNFALYITSDGETLSAEVYRRLSRTDNRANAGRQKYGGAPLSDRRPLSADVDDQTLRNLIAELQSYVNFQPGFMFISDD